MTRHSLSGLAVFLALGTPIASAQSRLDSATVDATVEAYEVRFRALGTLVEIKVFSADEALVRQTVQAAELRTQAIEATLTDYDPDSETSQLTERAAGERSIPVSPDLWNMLVASDRWYQKSQGAFDASLGSLTRQWRAARRTQQPLPEDQRLQAFAQSGWQHVQLNAEAKAVHFQREGIRLDFGAIGKGYVVDEIFKLLSDAGLTQCMVNISGNMRFGDAPPDRAGWRVEISPLEADEPPLRRLMLKNISIATSGDLWQYIVVEGERRSHILDPRTGHSVRGPIAATILTASATDADACATVVCVLGPTAGAQWVESLDHTEALVLEQSDPDASLRYIATEGFAKWDAGGR